MSNDNRDRPRSLIEMVGTNDWASLMKPPIGDEFLQRPSYRERSVRDIEDHADVIIAFDSIRQEGVRQSYIIKNRYGEAKRLTFRDVGFLAEMISKAAVSLRGKPTRIDFFEDSIAIEIEEEIRKVLYKYDHYR